jgi:hypothetical protein
VRDGGTRSSSEIEDLAAGGDPDVTDTSNDGGGDLRTEGIPYTVLDLAFVSLIDIMRKM